MSIICAQTSTKSYDIIVDKNILDSCGDLIKNVVFGKKAVIVTDSNVFELYAKRVEKSLERAGFSVNTVVFEAGEKSKSLETVNRLYEGFIKADITRADCVVALGGGVVGDCTGFAAGTFLRGVKFVQIPTTLLAQIDSSVGGKTGVNIPNGKNLIGMFNQPALVIADIATLTTLPDKIFADGLCEAIKYGVLEGELFNIINSQKISANSPMLLEIIEKCIKIKCRVVKEDEFDTGVRMTLNLGHTIGHAIEECGNYVKYTHGEAVGIGMVYAARISHQLALCDTSVEKRITHLLMKNNLPYTHDEDKNKVFSALIRDKKRFSDEINMILIEDIGKCVIKKLPVSKIKEILEV